MLNLVDTNWELQNLCQVCKLELLVISSGLNRILWKSESWVRNFWSKVRIQLGLQLGILVGGGHILCVAEYVSGLFWMPQTAWHFAEVSFWGPETAKMFSWDRTGTACKVSRSAGFTSKRDLIFCQWYLRIARASRNVRNCTANFCAQDWVCGYLYWAALS